MSEQMKTEEQSKKEEVVERPAPTLESLQQKIDEQDELIKFLSLTLQSHIKELQLTINESMEDMFDLIEPRIQKIITERLEEKGE